MSPSKPPNAVETSLTQDLIYAVRYYLGGRRGLILLTVVAISAGAALNWSWLVAVGVAPLLLAVAPCAVMCALGLCMHKALGRSSTTESEPTDLTDMRARPDKAITDGSDVIEVVSAETATVTDRSKNDPNPK